jgi:hypothetical protein
MTTCWTPRRRSGRHDRAPGPAGHRTQRHALRIGRHSSPGTLRPPTADGRTLDAWRPRARWHRGTGSCAWSAILGGDLGPWLEEWLGVLPAAAPPRGTACSPLPRKSGRSRRTSAGRPVLPSQPQPGHTDTYRRFNHLPAPGWSGTLPQPNRRRRQVFANPGKDVRAHRDRRGLQVR